jgi:hypothetical protein
MKNRASLKTLSLVLLIVSILATAGCSISTDTAGIGIVDEESCDVEVNSYDEFEREMIKASLNNYTCKEVNIKLNNYTDGDYLADSTQTKIVDGEYLLDRVKTKIEDEYPEILYDWKYYWSMNTPVDSRNSRIMNIEFKSNGKRPSNIYEVYTLEELEKTLFEAIHNLEDSIFFKIHGYAEEKYNNTILLSDFQKSTYEDYGFQGVRTSLVGEGKNKVLEVNLRYSFTIDELKQMKAEVDKKSEEIIARIIKPNMTDIEKEKAIFDYIIKNAQYSTTLSDTTDAPKEEYIAYGVLVKGEGVCDSYSKAMNKLLTMAGVESHYIVGMGTNSRGKSAHSWNIVKLGGEYYHVDATWGDPTGGKPTIDYAYFNVTDKKISKNHSWDRTQYPACTATKYAYRNLGKLQ